MITDSANFKRKAILWAMQPLAAFMGIVNILSPITPYLIYKYTDDLSSARHAYWAILGANLIYFIIHVIMCNYFVRYDRIIKCSTCNFWESNPDIRRCKKCEHIASWTFVKRNSTQVFYCNGCVPANRRRLTHIILDNTVAYKAGIVGNIYFHNYFYNHSFNRVVADYRLNYNHHGSLNKFYDNLFLGFITIIANLLCMSVSIPVMVCTATTVEGLALYTAMFCLMFLMPGGGYIYQIFENNWIINLCDSYICSHDIGCGDNSLCREQNNMAVENVANMTPSLPQSPPDIRIQIRDTAVLCVICLAKKPDTAVIPCGHTIFCDMCYHKFNIGGKCPICTTIIDKFIKTCDTAAD